MSETKSGSCICGAVTFTVDGGLRPVIACHCQTCRKASGHFVAFTAAWTESFEITQARGLKWYRSGETTERGFCGECGATLFFRRDGAEHISIAAGAFDGATGLALSAHIFAVEKGDYYTIVDDGVEIRATHGHHVEMPRRKAK